MSFISCRLLDSIPIRRISFLGLSLPRRLQFVTIICSALVSVIIYTAGGSSSSKKICQSSTIARAAGLDNYSDESVNNNSYYATPDAEHHHHQQPNIEWFSSRMKNTEHFPFSYYDESTQKAFKNILYWSDVDTS